MFATWRAAASLHIIPAKQMMVPLNFIRGHQLTVWFSVPSVAALLARMKLLRPGVFPSLRQTFFAGEPLLATVAAEWQKAAPSSVIVNMYGPTETTVICTGEEVHPDTPATRGILSIGRPFVGMKAGIASPESAWVNDGVLGELLLSGPQLALGYLDDPEKTESKFVNIDGERWYKSGDLATRDDNGLFHFRGRVDNQVKVLGYRVELEEIEFHLRAVSGCHLVAAIAWPLRDGTASGIVAFLAAYEGRVETIRKAMKQRVPSYMVPTEIHSLPSLPMNPNHKLDRNALKALLESQRQIWMGQAQSGQNPPATANE
jgi:acyl-coenzyme A synthetase/AMP-(fatty) acid ligase